MADPFLLELMRLDYCSRAPIRRAAKGGILALAHEYKDISPPCEGGQEGAEKLGSYGQGVDGNRTQEEATAR